MEEKRPFNYLFFGAFFLFLLLLSFSQLLFLGDGTTSFYPLFFVDAFLQSALEISLSLFLSTLLSAYFPKPTFWLFIAIISLVIFLTIVDFFLIRLLDFSIWFALDFVLEDKAKNFFELLDVTNVPLIAWYGLFAFIGSLILLGIFLYKQCEAVSKKRPFSYSLSAQSLTIGALFLTLLFWDYTTNKYLSFPQAERYAKALPFKGTPFTHPTQTLFLPSSLSSRSPSPSKITAKVAPDIFLFVVESVRDDFITPSNTPHIDAFKRQNTHFDLALSASNGTNISWFSLFFAKHAFHLKTANNGAPPLALLKQMGYDIHLYSASHLSYYQMDKRLFGDHFNLTTSAFLSSHACERKAWESDELVMQRLQDDITTRPRTHPRLFVIFLDSTHFDYSWNPKNTRFTPVAQGTGYWKALFGKAEIAGIQNRYKNALYHVDTLFGKFVDTLPNKDDSIVIFTADHGEEFYEKGFLFHISHLSREQTHIPLYISFGKNVPLPPCSPSPFISHVDIFPTLFHIIEQEEPPEQLFDGQSIFKENRLPFLITARYNANRTPFEFFIHDGKKKLVAQFENRSDIHSSDAIKILKVTTADDEPIPMSTSQAKEAFKHALHHLFAPKVSASTEYPPQ